MDISIIIVNYNTKELTLQTIASVFEKTTDIDFEVIVVDNASTDGSTETIENKFPAVKIIKSSENLGFGRANNKGIEIAKGRNVIFLNPDTILVNNAIKILSDYLDSNDQVGACGGNLLHNDLTPAPSLKMILPSITWELNDLFSNFFLKLIHGKYYFYNTSNKPKSVGYICGADLMVRKSVLEEVGSFDSDFFMYYEETDLCRRIHKAGYKVMSVPSARIIHLEGKSLSSSESKIKMLSESRIIYLKKAYKPYKVRLINAIYNINANIKYFIAYCLNNKTGKTYWGFIKKYSK